MPFNPFSPGMPLGPYMPPGLMAPYLRQQQPTFRDVSHRPRSPMEDYRREIPEIPPAPRAPVDVAMPPQRPMLTGDDGSIQTPEAAQRFADWRYAQSPSGPRGASMQPAEDRFGSMLRGIREVLPQQQQQPRSIQTTDPGAGYGMSPSGPTARLGSAQFPATPSYAPREGTWMHGNVQRPQGQAATYMERGGSPYRGQEYTSPSHPRYRGPSPRDNVTETTDPGRGYRGSPSNPNWQPRPKPMSPFYEPPAPRRPPTGGP